MSFIDYKEKLNEKCKRFFQRPKPDGDIQNGPWYDNAAVGKNTLGELMKTISKAAGLSQLFTNHSLRATCASVLDDARFCNREIRVVTGHKSDASIESYTRPKEPVKRQMSESISRACGILPKRAAPASSVGKIPVNELVSTKNIDLTADFGTMSNVADCDTMSNVADFDSMSNVADFDVITRSPRRKNLPKETAADCDGIPLNSPLSQNILKEVNIEKTLNSDSGIRVPNITISNCQNVTFNIVQK